VYVYIKFADGKLKTNIDLQHFMVTVGIIVYPNVSLTPQKVINHISDLKYIL
jgi:hypothetical protein